MTMRIKFEGWYREQLLQLAKDNNTTPTQILNSFIKSTSHTAQDAKEQNDGIILQQ